VKNGYEAWAKNPASGWYDAKGQYDTLAAAAEAAGLAGRDLYRHSNGNWLYTGSTVHDAFVGEVRIPETLEDRVGLALDLIGDFRSVDGQHHHLWLTDQVTRLLAGDGYEEFVRRYKSGEDGPDTYDWVEGIAP